MVQDTITEAGVQAAADRAVARTAGENGAEEEGEVTVEDAIAFLRELYSEQRLREALERPTRGEVLDPELGWVRPRTERVIRSGGNPHR